MTALKVRSKNPKTFEDVFPRLDSGKTDWDTVKQRVRDNIELSSFVFGKTQPQAIQLEEAVIGACLIQKDAFDIAREAMLFEKKPFYADHHNHIWAAMLALRDKNEPIDILTTTFELKKMEKLEAVGGAYLLVEITNRVASSANMEYHARIVYQMFLKRRLLAFCTQTIRDVYEDSCDIFDLTESLSRELHEFENPRSALKAEGMNVVMEKAKNALPKAFLVGDLIKWNDVAILFSGPANGKSVFSMQMADALSKGKGLFSNLLRNECGRQKVLYFDLELQYSDFKSRYMDAAENMYNFETEEWFVRVGNDEDNPSTFADFSKNADYLISRNIEKHKPSIVFVDNITALANGATADYEVASKIMDILMLMKKKYKLTVIVLAHTPKRYNITVPITINDLAGSAMLANYADSVITIGASKMGDKVKYIKQIKVRSGEKRFDDENIIQIGIEKDGAFLQYKTLEEPTGRERDHLIDFNEENQTPMLDGALKLQREGMGLRKIIENLGLKMSHTQLGFLLKKHELGVTQNELGTKDIIILDHKTGKPQVADNEGLPF